MPAFPPDEPAPSDGRYHRSGHEWPLYGTLEPETAWAEWSAATRGAVDPAGVIRSLWQLEVVDLPVIDLRDPEARGALGVGIEDLTGSWSACQPLADRAREIGALGMVVPSAARPDAWNLLVFRGGLAHLRVAGRSVGHPAVSAIR